MIGSVTGGCAKGGSMILVIKLNVCDILFI